MTARSSSSPSTTSACTNRRSILDFEIPYSVAELDKAAREVIRANNLTDAYVRPIAWRGSEQMGVAAQQTKTNVAIAAWDWGSYFDPAARAKGLRLKFADLSPPRSAHRAGRRARRPGST